MRGRDISSACCGFWLFVSSLYEPLHELAKNILSHTLKLLFHEGLRVFEYEQRYSTLPRSRGSRFERVVDAFLN